jgi:hypothetical protein
MTAEADFGMWSFLYLTPYIFHFLVAVYHVNVDFCFIIRMNATLLNIVHSCIFTDMCRVFVLAMIEVESHNDVNGKVY